MSLLQTRAQIRARLRRQSQRQANSGAYSDPDLNEAIQIATDQVWYELTATDEGYGETSTTIEIVAAAPGAGQALAGDTLDLPADYLDLRALARLDTSGRSTVPALYSRREFDSWMLGTNDKPADDFYLLEGPTYDAAGTETPQRIRFVPALEAGESVRIGYVTQGPQWPDDVQQYDMIAEAVLGALVSFARVIATTRDDNTEYSKAQQDVGAKIGRFVQQRRRRNKLGVDHADRYRGRRRWIGYR